MTGNLSRKRPYRAHSNEEGFVLVTVLIVIALLFVLVLKFNSGAQLSLTQAENFRNSVQAVRMARSGVQGAVAVLKASDPTYDSPKSTWAMGIPGLALAQGILTVNIVDEDCRMPVNNLVWSPTQAAAATSTTSTGTSASTSSTATTGQGQTTTATTATAATAAKATETVNKDLNTQLRALVTSLGGNQEVIDSLTYWLDTDIVTGVASTDASYYSAQGYQAKNGPLDSLDELLLVRGFDKELVDDRGLQDYLTVAPTDGKLNINTASQAVLQIVLGTQTSALAQPLGQADVADLVQYRNQHEIRNLSDIMAVKISQGDLSKITPLIKVNSTYFTVTSKYTIGKVVKSVEALLKRSGSTVSIVSWRES